MVTQDCGDKVHLKEYTHALTSIPNGGWISLEVAVLSLSTEKYQLSIWVELHNLEQ